MVETYTSVVVATFLYDRAKCRSDRHVEADYTTDKEFLKLLEELEQDKHKEYGVVTFCNVPQYFLSNIIRRWYNPSPLFNPKLAHLNHVFERQREYTYLTMLYKREYLEKGRIVFNNFTLSYHPYQNITKMYQYISARDYFRPLYDLNQKHKNFKIPYIYERDLTAFLGGKTASVKSMGNSIGDQFNNSQESRNLVFFLKLTEYFVNTDPKPSVHTLFLGGHKYKVYAQRYFESLRSMYISNIKDGIKDEINGTIYDYSEVFTYEHFITMLGLFCSFNFSDNTLFTIGVCEVRGELDYFLFFNNYRKEKQSKIIEVETVKTLDGKVEKFKELNKDFYAKKQEKKIIKRKNRKKVSKTIDKRKK